MALLILRGKHAKGDLSHALVDDEDLPRLNEHKWRLGLETHNSRNGVRVPYNINKLTVKTDIKGKTVSLHRFIMDFPDGIVDHKNGNRLDNRRENLRLSTQSQNNCNLTQAKTFSSRYRGVRKLESGRFEVRISVSGKKYYVGSFDGEVEAAKAYDYMALKLHGSFASLNFSVIEDYSYLPEDNSPF